MEFSRREDEVTSLPGKDIFHDCLPKKEPKLRKSPRQLVLLTVFFLEPTTCKHWATPEDTNTSQTLSLEKFLRAEPHAHH